MSTSIHDDRSLLLAAEAALSTRQPRKALELLNHSKSDSLAVRNARGVCLLRMGECQKAQDHFRALVVDKNGLSLRERIPTAVRANYALALLANGNPTGVENLLFEMADEGDAAVQRVRVALSRWKATLPAWRRLLLRLGVQLKFSPVVLEPDAAAVWIPQEEPAATRPVQPSRAA